MHSFTAASTVIALLLASSPVHAYDFRPYIEWNGGDAITNTTQPKLIMAFGLQNGNDYCVPGFEAPPTSGIVGQDLFLSFGGAAGTHVHQNCTRPTALGTNLAYIIDAIKPVGLDFDLEGDHCANLSTLAAAAAGLRRWRPNTMIGVTIAANENGLAQPDATLPNKCTGAGILQAFKEHNVTLDYINIMNMYLNSPTTDPNTFIGVINTALTAIKQVPGYENWCLSKMGVTFTWAGGNGVMTADIATQLVKVLPQDLAFVSLWKYIDVTADAQTAMTISQIFRNSATSQFGPSPAVPPTYGGTHWGFGQGSPLSFKFWNQNWQQVATNGGIPPIM